MFSRPGLVVGQGPKARWRHLLSDSRRLADSCRNAGRARRQARGGNRRTGSIAAPGPSEIRHPAGVRKISDQGEPLTSKGFKIAHTPQAGWQRPDRRHPFSAAGARRASSPSSSAMPTPTCSPTPTQNSKRTNRTTKSCASSTPGYPVRLRYLWHSFSISPVASTAAHSFLSGKRIRNMIAASRHEGAIGRYSSSRAFQYRLIQRPVSCAPDGRVRL